MTEPDGIQPPATPREPQVVTGSVGGPPKPDAEALVETDVRTSHQKTLSESGNESEGLSSLRPSEVTIGSQLGPYLIVRKLGEGGMGAVFEARHTKLKKTVAVKVLPPKFSQSAMLISRFEREMEAVGTLDHPHIVRAMDAGEFQGTHFLVMEYVEGRDLSVMVKERGPRSVIEACEMIRQAAVGLAHAHQHGLVHRDIKPGNLFATKSSLIKILDLGLALAQGAAQPDSDAGALTKMGQFLGTPDYMAPEQWENSHTADGRADLYALGCTLFFLLTGRAPYADAAHPSWTSKLRGHTTEPIPDLREARREAIANRPKLLNDPLPDEVEALYRRLMAKLPAERIATADELAKTLQEIVKSLRPSPGSGEKSGINPQLSGTALAAGVSPSNAGSPPSNTSSTQGNIAPSTPVASAIPLKENTATADIPTIIDTPTADTETDEFAFPQELSEPTSTATTKRAKKPSKSTKARGRSGLFKTIGLCLGGLAAVVLCGVIIIKLTKKDGSTLEVTVPADTKIIEITESLSDRSAPAPGSVRLPSNVPGLTPTDSPTKGTGWHGWPADAPPPAIAPFNAEQAKQHQEAWAKHLGVPIEYTNSLGMKFSLIPPGEFTMGSTPAEIEEALKFIHPSDKHLQVCAKSEAPKHKVILTQPIYLGVHEVTQADYEKVMGKNPSFFAATGAEKERSDKVAGIDTTSHPVEGVTWNDAAEFCAKLSQAEQLKPFYFRVGEKITPLDGTGYRLPTEAEWEFAGRSGATTRFWINDKDEDLVLAGWFVTNSGDRPHVAGELQANPFGLFDVHGNVWEWVQDLWEPTFSGEFQDNAAINPNGPTFAGSWRVSKGGSWRDAASICRVASRNANDPTERHFNVGFRVSLTLAAVRQTLKITEPTMSKSVTTTPPIAPAVGTSDLGSKAPSTTKSASEVVIPKRMEAPPPIPVEPVKPPAATAKTAIAKTSKSVPLAVKVPRVEIPAAPLPTKPNKAISNRAMVSLPAPIPGLRGWSIEVGGHTGVITGLAYSPDGQSVATVGGNDDTVRLWKITEVANAPVLTLDRVFLGEEGGIQDVSWSPDGFTLATTSYMGHSVTLFDVPTGRMLKRIALTNGSGVSVAWSPDGRLIAAAHLTHMGLIDPIRGVVRLSQRSAFYHTGCWSPDGSQIASVDEAGGIKFWKPQTLEPTAEFDSAERRLQAVAWSPDGKWVATGGNEGVIKIWEAATKKRLHELRPELSGILGLSWEPAAAATLPTKHAAWPRLACVGTEGKLVVWDAAKGDKLLDSLIPGQSSKVAWSPDGTQIAVAPFNDLELHDSSTGKLITTTANFGSPHFVNANGNNLSASGKELRVQQYTELTVWDADSGSFVKRVENLPTGQSLASPTDEWLAVFDENSPQGNLHLVDTATYQDHRALLGHGSNITAVNWSSDGKTLASSSKDQTVRLWNAATGEQLKSIPHPNAVQSVVWSPDGKRLATCGNDDIIRLWLAATGTAAGEFPRLPSPGRIGPSALAWSPDGKYLAIADRDGATRVLDLKSGKLSDPILLLGTSVGSVAWSGDSKQLLAGTYGEVGYRTLSAREGVTLYGYGVPVQWHPDRRRILTGMGGYFPLQGLDAKRNVKIGALYPSIVGGHHVCISADGHYRGSNGIEQHIVYVALTKDGHQQTYSPADFAAKFNWKNDPTKARLLQADK